MKTTRAYASPMKPFAAMAAAVLLAAGCQREAVNRPVTSTAGTAAAPAPTALSHHQEIEQWQAKRAERLKAEDGWLTLVGLFWLDEGDNVVALPGKGAPALKLSRTGGKVTLQPAATLTIGGKPVSAPVDLVNDADPNGPTVVQTGSIRFQVIKRGERYGLRVKDSESPTRTQFAGLQYFPIDSKYRVEARMEPYNPVKKIPITDVTGMTSDSDSPGALVFTLEGKEYRIDPVLEEGSDELFIIFKDQTSRDATYQAGRYLYAAKPGPDGKTVVDFNKAYNPPCAFTHFATCPLPPQQNRLPIRIEAGEKRAHG